MKLKLLLTVIVAIISILIGGCSKMNHKRMDSSNNNSNISSMETIKTEQTTITKAIISYSKFTGDWVCKDKNTSIDIVVDDSGNVKGAIVTVVGTHVPGLSFVGTIKNDILEEKLYDEGVDRGALTLSFANQDVLKGNIKLNDNNPTYKDGRIAEGDMAFEKYSNNSTIKSSENLSTSTPVPTDSPKTSNDSTPLPNYESKVLNSQVYSNTEFRFALTFPESWKGKCFIIENKYGISVNYNCGTGKKKGIMFEFFGIGRSKKSDWIENSGAPVEKICEKSGYVYYANFPSEEPFDANLKDEKKDAEEFTNLNKDTESIIKSLKVID